MAVVETHTKEHGKQAVGSKAWLKKNKLIAGGVGVGGIVLLMASKGKKSTKSELGEELKQDTELARQAEQERQIAASGNPSSTGGGSGGGEGSTGAASTPTTAASVDTETAKAISEGDTALAADIQANDAAIEGLAAKATVPGSEGGESQIKAQYTKAEAEKAKLEAKLKKKTAAKKAAKPKPKTKSKTTAATKHSGTTVDGRHFPGAVGHTVTKHTKDSKGKVNKTVKVDHGGKTTTHISHDNGKSWTDHPAGSSPPSKTTHAQSHPANKPIPKLQPKAKVVAKLEKKPAPKKAAPKKVKRVRA